MPSISQFFGVVIYMYFNDYIPSHFYAEYGEYEAVYEIETLETCAADCPVVLTAWYSNGRWPTVQNCAPIGNGRVRKCRWSKLLL